MKILKVVYVGHYPSAAGVVFEVEENSVDHIELALFVFVLDAHLVTVSLTDRAVLVSPAVPDVASEVFYIV